MNDKESLRQHYRAIRAGISLEAKLTAGKQAAEIFASRAELKLFRKIGCYFPFKSEFDTLPLIELIWREQKECFLPMLHGGALRFVSYERDDELADNVYGIKEPVDTRVIATEMLDLVFLPLTAFDKQGHRLGTGGGFYDKTLAFINDEPEHRPLLVGVGFAAQEAKMLPADAWDIRLDAVLTETQFIKM